MFFVFVSFFVSLNKVRFFLSLNVYGHLATLSGDPYTPHTPLLYASYSPPIARGPRLQHTNLPDQSFIEFHLDLYIFFIQYIIRILFGIANQ